MPLAAPNVVLLVVIAETMLEPGANTSTQVPQFEKLDLVSNCVLAPTLIALGALPGEFVQASALLLPAAVTTTTPRSVAL